jgi:hypothetical protein
MYPYIADACKLLVACPLLAASAAVNCYIATALVSPAATQRRGFADRPVH